MSTTRYPEGRRALVTFTEHGETVTKPMLVLEHGDAGLVGLVTIERVLVAEQIERIEWMEPS